jgi:hypothetical protein
MAVKLPAASVVVASILTGPAFSHAGEALSVQVEATEAGLVVSESLEIAEASRFTRIVLPILVPAEGPGPAIVAKSEARPDGLETDSSGVVAVELQDGVVAVRRTAEGAQGETTASVRYVLPIRGPRMTLVLDVGADLESVRFVIRRSPDPAIHLRPLFPYAYEEETSEDGTWQTLTVPGGARQGTRLVLVAGHLPEASGPYRALALGAAVVVVLGFLACLWHYRRRT